VDFHFVLDGMAIVIIITKAFGRGDLSCGNGFGREFVYQSKWTMSTHYSYPEDTISIWGKGNTATAWKSITSSIDTTSYWCSWGWYSKAVTYICTTQLWYTLDNRDVSIFWPEHTRKYLIPCSRRFEKLVVAQVVKKFPPFIEPEVSLPCS
jgi:hypothetical protein